MNKLQELKAYIEEEINRINNPSQMYSHSTEKVMLGKIRAYQDILAYLNEQDSLTKSLEGVKEVSIPKEIKELDKQFKSLEEAAEKYAVDFCEDSGEVGDYFISDCKIIFKAGATWQSQNSDAVEFANFLAKENRVPDKYLEGDIDTQGWSIEETFGDFKSTEQLYSEFLTTKTKAK